jgi:hypothetical protein
VGDVGGICDCEGFCEDACCFKLKAIGDIEEVGAFLYVI